VWDLEAGRERRTLGSDQLSKLNQVSLSGDGRQVVFVTGGEFTPDELLSNAHALMVLAPHDPRRERICLAVLRGQEAQQNGDRKAVLRYKLEFTVELLRLMQ
jgi:hypothetical protein